LEGGPPGFPQDFSCPVVLRIPLRVRSVFGYVAFTLSGPAFQPVHLTVRLVTLLTRSYNPLVQAPGFGLFRFRSPLLSESRLISLPPGTEMVHFPGLARTRLWIQRAVSRFSRDGFPHSDISGSKPACGSPKLIAACHVLLRLLAPRHPPHALSSLTIKLAPHVTPELVAKPRCRPGQVRLHIALERYFCGLQGTHPGEIPGLAPCSCQPDSVFKDRPSRSRRNGPLHSPAFGAPRGPTKNPAPSAGHNRRRTSRRFRSKLARFLARVRDHPLSGSQWTCSRKSRFAGRSLDSYREAQGCEAATRPRTTNHPGDRHPIWQYRGKPGGRQVRLAPGVSRGC
jgi:hypothetical protein